MECIFNTSDDPKLIKLMMDALHAVCGYDWDGSDVEAQSKRTAAASEIMTAIAKGERDPERLKLVAIAASCQYDWQHLFH
jgi:hypothetical protein